MLLFLAFTTCLSITHALNTRGSNFRTNRPITNGRVLPRDTAGDPCGRVFQGGNLSQALDAYSCLASVPINRTVASQFLQYYKDTMEFQSTLTYLKNPPSSYQQPPTDLLGGLDNIQRQLGTGVFTNEYEFEVAVLDLVYSAHDGHTDFYGGATNVFSFGSPFEICSVSVDGVQPPEVYIADDLYESLYGDYTASPIATINGQPVLEYLRLFAATNSGGYLEPHADWNSLMYSSAADIQGLVNTFTGSSPFYPGDVMSVILKNGTTADDSAWMAVLNDPNNEGAVASVSEFYDTFVASNSIASPAKKSKRKRAAATTAAAQSSAPSATPTPWTSLAYPVDPFVSNMGDGGAVTGYLIDDSAAVLSIPTFDTVDDNARKSFSATVGKFLEKSREFGARKIVIDLQQNYGGTRLLATDTFKHFFPEIAPYSGSRERAHNTADTLGKIYTEYYNSHVTSLSQSDLNYLSHSLWVAPNFLNAATGHVFASWEDYYGPHEDHLDFFTTTQRDNLTNTIVNENTFGREVYGYSTNATKMASPYDAQDIVILTDALCSSTCALFVEMMHHDAGVRTIVVGGLPQLLGPMQTVAGSRGARRFESDLLDLDIFGADTLNPSLASQLPDRVIDFNFDTASFNLQDQVRKGENFPLQFAYEAAECRIYYTMASIFNMTALWSHAAQATWRDRSLCVKHSIDHPSSTSKASDTLGPSPEQRAAWAYPPSALSASQPPDPNTAISLADLEASQSPETDIAGHEGAQCHPDQSSGYCKQLNCVQAPWCSPQGHFIPDQYQCVRLEKYGCNPGQVVASGNCKLTASGKCSYCTSKRKITSKTCGTSTAKNTVPDDRTSRSPRGRGG